MKNEQYQKLESILMSWWDSLPEEMQKELKDFYEDEENNNAQTS